MSIHPLVRAVREGLAARGDPSKAPEMQRYMRSAMPFRGVSAPQARQLWRDVFRRSPLKSFDEWERVILTLWRDARFREERYGAIALADRPEYAAYRTRDALPMLEELIVTGAWWDLVDPIASHLLGDVLASERRAGVRRGRQMAALLRRWAGDGCLWKRRAAILCQLRFGRGTDVDLLNDCIARNLLRATGGRRDSIADDFFIRKAIGWALRQYARTDPGAVRRYVSAHRDRLSPLSIREATRHIG